MYPATNKEFASAKATLAQAVSGLVTPLAEYVSSTSGVGDVASKEAVAALKRSVEQLVSSTKKLSGN